MHASVAMEAVDDEVDDASGKEVPGHPPAHPGLRHPNHRLLARALESELNRMGVGQGHLGRSDALDALQAGGESNTARVGLDGDGREAARVHSRSAGDPR